MDSLRNNYHIRAIRWPFHRDLLRFIDIFNFFSTIFLKIIKLQFRLCSLVPYHVLQGNKSQNM